MGGTYNVENTKKVLGLVIELGNVTGKALEDDKLAITDAALLLNLYDEVIAVAGTEWNLIPSEVTELDDADKVELCSFFSEKFDIPQDKVESVIEVSLAVVVQLASSIAGIKTIIDAIKAAKA
jgi:hypothetical protein